MVTNLNSWAFKFRATRRRAASWPARRPRSASASDSESMLASQVQVGHLDLESLVPIALRSLALQVPLT